MNFIMDFLIKLGIKAMDFYHNFGFIGLITFYGMFFFMGMCIRFMIDFIVKVILPLF